MRWNIIVECVGEYRKQSTITLGIMERLAGSTTAENFGVNLQESVPLLEFNSAKLDNKWHEVSARRALTRSQPGAAQCAGAACGNNGVRPTDRWANLRAESSVNHQARTCDVGSLGSRQIGNHSCDFLGRAVARQRIRLLEHCGKFAIVGVHLSIHRAGLHVIDRNSAPPQVARKSLYQPLQR